MATAHVNQTPILTAGYGAGINPHRSLVWLIDDSSNAYQHVLPGLDTGLVSPAEVGRWIERDVYAWLQSLWLDAQQDATGSLWNAISDRLVGAAMVLRISGYAAISAECHTLSTVASLRGALAVAASCDWFSDDGLNDGVFDLNETPWSSLGYTG